MLFVAISGLCVLGSGLICLLFICSLDFLNFWMLFVQCLFWVFFVGRLKDCFNGFCLLCFWVFFFGVFGSSLSFFPCLWLRALKGTSKN